MMGRPVRKIGFSPDRLHEARRAKRLTQKELARLVGVHGVTLIRWEKGLNEPSPEQLQRLAVACGRPAAFFLGEQVEDHDTRWLTDPSLAARPLGDLQKRTAAALRGLLSSQGDVAQLARVAGLPEERMQALVSGASLPFPREIQQLRDAFGELYDPTPTAAAATIPLSVPVSRVSPPETGSAGYGQARYGEARYSQERLLTAEELLDVLLRRLSRLEQRMGGLEEYRQQLYSIQQHLSVLEGRLDQLAPAAASYELIEKLSDLLGEYLKSRLGEEAFEKLQAATDARRSGRSG